MLLSGFVDGYLVWRCDEKKVLWVGAAVVRDCETWRGRVNVPRVSKIMMFTKPRSVAVGLDSLSAGFFPLAYSPWNNLI